ncbi:MAG: twin-arginine translocase subunit TatC [bacterium]
MDIESDKIYLFLHNLRQKIITIFIFIFLASFLCYFFRDSIWNLAKSPYLKIKPGQILIFITPVEAFYINLKISVFGGIFLTVPFIFYHIFSLLPVKAENTVRSVLFISLASFLLFAAGIVFSYNIVIPQALKFFLQFENESLSAQWTASGYLSFFLWTLFSFGLIFELPLIIYFLTKFNIVHPDVLRKNRSYAILIVFITAGLLTPGPDIMSQILLALPMIILYETGIWFSYLPRQKIPNVHMTEKF